MIKFTARIMKYDKKGEKSGWSYIEISSRHAEKLNPGCRVSFRVRGKIDQHPVTKTALLPMGEGSFILPFNAGHRKATGKCAGDTVKVEFELDDNPLEMSADFIACLRDEPRAYEFFQTLPKSHQRYFSNWIEDAKTVATKTKRITMAVIGLASGMGFGEMIRANKQPR